jgi:hypothetical protein
VRRPLVLAAVAAGILIVVAAIVLVRVLSSRTEVAPAEVVPGRGVPIAALEEAELSTIELVSAQGSFRLEKREGAWGLVAPVSFAVRAEIVSSIIASFTGLVSERVIEDRSDDLAQYGLEPPVARARATTSDGATLELRLGERTPAGSTCYLMAGDDPRVFVVWSTHAQHLGATLNDLYQVQATPINSFYVNYLKVLAAGTPVVEIARTTALVEADPEFRGTYLSVVYPYRRPKPVNSSYLNDTFLKTISELPMDVVIDANPASLAPYGLDRPRYELIVKDDTTTLHLMVGSSDGKQVFFRHVGQQPVFATDPLFAVLLGSQKPFDWVNRLAMIVDERAVEGFTIESERGTHEVAIARVTPDSDEGATFTVDGSPVTERAFRDFYQRMISLGVDAAHDKQVPDRGADLVFTFRLNRGNSRTFRVSFVPWDPVFYAVVKNGVSDLLVNRRQVENLIEVIEAFAATARTG